MSDFENKLNASLANAYERGMREGIKGAYGLGALHGLEAASFPGDTGAVMTRLVESRLPSVLRRLVSKG